MLNMRWNMRVAHAATKIPTLCHQVRHNLRLAGSTCDSHVVSHMGQFDFFFRKNQKNLTTFGSNGPLESLLPYEDLKVFKNTRTSQKFNYPQINSKLTQISDLSSLQCREQSPIGFNLQLHLLQQDPLSSSWSFEAQQWWNTNPNSKWIRNWRFRL